MITKKTLITWSIIRDALNWMLVGQIPGLCQLLDIPLLIMHFKYAGASASFALLELIPGAGLVPIFTIACFCYPDNTPPVTAVSTIQQAPTPLPPAIPPMAGPTALPPFPEPPKDDAALYACVDGKFTRIRLSSDQQERIIRHIRAKAAAASN